LTEIGGILKSMKPLYDDDKELQIAIDKYLSECIVNKEFPNVASLAYSLGYATRQSIYDLEKDEKHSYTIKRAILFIESKTVDRALTSNAPTGSIFVLKNMGWKDKFENEVSGSMEIKRYDIPNKLPVGSPCNLE
jgi:hypothetical protein